MEAYVDFYRALRDLLCQIPEGAVTTPLALAEALGDRHASRAVSEAMQREELREYAGRVVRTPRGAGVFRDFSTDRPLRKLAELQETLSKRVVQEDRFGSTDLIAGVDAAYIGDVAFAVCAVLDGRLRLVESSSAKVEVRFPYIPGYLSFREAPVVEAAARLVSGFDVLMVNGHGIAHPRGLGLASQVGLDLEAAAVGVARRLLVGTVGKDRDGWAPIIYRCCVVGGRLTVEDRAPVYVSVGNNISLRTSIGLVRRTIGRGPLPEPLRRAHQAVEKLARSVGGSFPLFR